MLVTDLLNINPSLENIKMALSLIANPQDSFKSIQIAGTNGKGSVATWLELMFLSFLKKLEVLDSSDADDFLKNRKVGKYTSPHLISVTERVAVNGNNIVEDEFHNLFFELFGESFNADVEDISNHKAFPAESKHQKIYSSPPLSSQKLGFNLSYFEKLTILAFEYFKRQNVDLAILEVGMGGRWDATNVILPNVLWLQ